MAQSWAVEFRPPTLDEILGQDSIIKILKRQLELGIINHCYLFTGPSGDGKTTTARALSSAITHGKGQPEEIDGASNNGVDAVRAIIENARQRAIDAEYKIFIIDEAHMITVNGWNAFLKTIEEPPEYTIFMFCTTNPEKIPATITNRCMRFNFTKVATNLIRDRLIYIAEKKNCKNYTEACDFIAKLAQGGMRDGISMLEKCANYSMDLSIENVLECLGNFSYDAFFNLTGSLLNQDEAAVIEAVENYYNSGKDLKVFIENYLEFCLDLTKYCLFKDMSATKIPLSLHTRCEGYSKIPNILNYSNKLVDKLLNIKNTIKYDVNYKNTVEVMMINICRGE